MDSVWTALVDHPRLEKVSLNSKSIVPVDFWRVCARLRTLEFSNSEQRRVEGRAAIHDRRIPKDLMLPSIRRLKLASLYMLGPMDGLNIIAACPLLEDLEWMGYAQMNPMWAIFGQLAAQGAWPHLRQLSTDFYVEDADLSVVIASMHRATKVRIYNHSLGPLSFAALQRHAGTLQHLSIPETNDSEMIRDVLCTFTRLECSEAQRIDAIDIVEGGPWVCTSLRKMSVSIWFSSEEKNLQPVVFERISRLVHLEEFMCWANRFYGVRSDHGLIFRLQLGMATLASLSRLRSLELDSDNQAMDFDDARWIVDHWKRLKTIRGWLSPDKSMNEQLKVLILQAK
ncbi:hypothetical protein BGZ98_001690 [Dissophora globulifera]|nr:hypothetical protein BGZ98_001690 [Dissophora globulifera]